MHSTGHQTSLLLIQVLLGALGVLAPFASVHIVLVGNVPAYLLPMQSEVLGERIISGLCVFEAGYDDEFFILAVQQLLLRLFLGERVGPRHACEDLPEIELLEARLGVLHLAHALVGDGHRLLLVNQLDVLHMFRH